MSQTSGCLDGTNQPHRPGGYSIRRFVIGGKQLVAGEDGAFKKAEATIDGDSVVVKSTEVAAPVAVRYGWNQSAEPNLSNKDGLPASPFRAGGK